MAAWLRHPAIDRGREGRHGQSLVEFALAIPIFFALLIGLIEFGFALNAVLTSNFATREASLIAAEAGNTAGADCVILKMVDDRVTAPADRGQITQVRIYKATASGGVVAGKVNTYARTGSLACVVGSTSFTLPYQLVGPAGYLETTRCNVAGGCAGTTSVDHIGVEMTYLHTWRTGAPGIIGMSGPGYTIIKSNAMRMEPVL
jgi:Flp pilus assembly protein TadG